MIRPFFILAFWTFMWGYLPKMWLDDYRASLAMLFFCSIATAATEWAIQKWWDSRAAGQ